MNNRLTLVMLRRRERRQTKKKGLGYCALWAFVVLRTEDMYTIPLLIYLLQGELRTPYGMLMAAGLLATLPLVLAFLVFQRSFVRGMTAGAIRG